MTTRRAFLVSGAVSAVAAGAAVWAGLRPGGAGSGDDGPDGAEPGSATGSAPPTTVAAPGGSPAAAAATGRVLVVLQQAGGNDGLNTVVPADGRYRSARATLAIPEAEVVALGGRSDVGLHPSLAPLVPLWDAGRLAVVQGVGYADAGRSHFEALDWLWSATPGRASPTGWVGRYLDARMADGADENPLRAVALGTGSPALIGERSTATVVLDPSAFTWRAPRPTSTEAMVAALSATTVPASSTPLVAAAQHALADAVTAVGTFAALAASAAGEPGDDEVAPAEAAPGRSRSGFTGLLDVAAELIVAGLGTEVVFVGAGGYDTHAGQLTTHATLLDDLAGGLAAFFDRLGAAGVADRVLVCTTSEFGRRVAENASGGTDHGRAGAHFLAGPGVAGGVYGATDLGALLDGDVPPVVDPRTMYAAGLTWLGMDPAEVLGSTFDTMGLLA